MELGPIFRALMHHKSRFWLIALEVGLTLAIVANCVNIMLEQRQQLHKPSGLDEAHIVEVRTEPFGEHFKDASFRDVQWDEDLQTLRALPGVHAATGISFTPLGGGGALISRTVPGTEIEDVPTPIFTVRGQALEALGLELMAGRSFEPGDWPSETEGDETPVVNVIITQHLAEQFFSDGQAVGRGLATDEGELREIVIGVVRRMHNAWPRSPIGESAMLIPGTPGYGRDMRYLVRAEPGATEAIFPLLEPALREANPDRVITVRTMAEIKRRTFDDTIVLVKALSVMIVILVLVTGLGIVGLTSFSVTQRTRQIGTRRALGATRGQILRYFLIENWMITGFGLVLGAALSVGLNLALTHFAGAPRMPWSLLLGGALLLWLAGLAAAAAPALRAAMVPPELATRTV